MASSCGYSLWDIVEITGLEKRAEMNGTRGIVTGWDGKKVRVVAALSGKAFALGASKLKAAAAPKKLISATALAKLASYRVTEKGDYDLGSCPICKETSLGILSPFCVECGESVCLACHGETCEFCRKPTKRAPKEAAAALRNHVSRGEPRAFLALASVHFLPKQNPLFGKDENEEGPPEPAVGLLEASRLILALVELGYAEPILLVASQCLENGFSSDGERWLRKAAEKKCAAALFKLGDVTGDHAYYHRCVATDPKHAEAWLRIAHKLYDAEDYEKAYDAYLESARQGNTDAMGRLAVIFMKGVGRPKNSQMGIDWIGTAAYLGCDRAKDIMLKLNVVVRRPPEAITDGAPDLRRMLSAATSRLKNPDKEKHYLPPPGSMPMFYSAENAEKLDAYRRRAREADCRWKPPSPFDGVAAAHERYRNNKDEQEAHPISKDDDKEEKKKNRSTPLPIPEPRRTFFR